MEITSVCPYCGKEMRDGAIPVYRGNMYWHPRNEDGTISNGFDSDGEILLGRAGFFGGYTPAYYCENCKAVIMPVPEIECTLDKLDRKLDEWREKRSAQQQARQAQREEKKREERSKKRREKDPWEV